MMVDQPMGANDISNAAGGYGPPGGGFPPGGGGYGGPPQGGQPPGGFGPPPGAPPGGGYGGPPPGAPPGGGYGGPPQGAPPGGFGGPPMQGPPGGFGPPGGGFPPPGGPMGAGGDVNTTLPLVLSIIATVCCCLPLGIGGIVFSMQANTAKKAGDMVTAQSKAKTALIMAIVGMVGGALIYTVYGIVMAMNN